MCARVLTSRADIIRPLILVNCAKHEKRLPFGSLLYIGIEQDCKRITTFIDTLSKSQSRSLLS